MTEMADERWTSAGVPSSLPTRFYMEKIKLAGFTALFPLKLIVPFIQVAAHHLLILQLGNSPKKWRMTHEKSHKTLFLKKEKNQPQSLNYFFEVLNVFLTDSKTRKTGGTVPVFIRSPLLPWCWPTGADWHCTNALVFQSIPIPTSKHREELFCPYSPSDIHGMRSLLSFQGHVCPHHLYSHSSRWQHIHFKTHMADLHPQAFALYLLRETCAKSYGLPLLISFCLVSASLQHPTELDFSQCYPWDCEI